MKETDWWEKTCSGLSIRNLDKFRMIQRLTTYVLSYMASKHQTVHKWTKVSINASMKNLVEEMGHLQAQNHWWCQTPVSYALYLHAYMPYASVQSNIYIYICNDLHLSTFTYIYIYIYDSYYSIVIYKARWIKLSSAPAQDQVNHVHVRISAIVIPMLC